MEDLKQLREALEKSVAKLETVSGMLADAEKSGDEAGLATATKAYEQAVAERDGLTTKLEKAISEAKAERKTKSLLGEVDSLTKAVPPPGADLSGTEPDAGDQGEQPIEKRLAAEATDRKRKELEKRELFFQFMSAGGKGMGGQALEALRPTTRELLVDDTPQAVIPKSIVAGMFPGLVGKALPMTSLDDDDSGGRANLVYPDYGTQILQLPPDEPSLFLRVSKHTTVGGSLVEARLQQDDDNEFGGVAVQWTDEATDAPDTEMEIEKITITCHPLKAYTAITKVLLSRDRYDFERQLVDKLRKALTAKFDHANMHGTGVKMPLGIRVMDGIRTVTRQTASTVTYDDLVGLKHAVKPQHRGGATFAIADGVEEALEGTKDTTGRPLFTANTGAGPYNRLANVPYFVSHQCSAIGTAGDIVFGNLLHYWFVLEQEIAVARSEHAEFKKGGIAYRVDALAGGRPMFERAFAILAGAGS
ncbi:MAG: phage major capsid protein [Armatimonadia bacterium]|nr:phage major capsid protein [Armatimonadia bacterium]